MPPPAAAQLTMRYRETPASSALARVVSSFFAFEVGGDDAGEPARHTVLPDGCVSILYCRNRRTGLRLLLVVNLNLESATYDVRGGDVYWGMRVAPSACARFFEIAPATIRSQPLVLLPAFAAFADELGARLDDAADFAAAVQIYEQTFRPRADIEIDAAVADAVRFIEENRAAVKVSEVARRVLLSERQLARRFKQTAGLAPKQFIRARRLRHAAVDLIDNADAGWATRALEFGFADQAHLANEFAAVVKRTPAAHAEQVSRIEYGEIVE